MPKDLNGFPLLLSILLRQNCYAQVLKVGKRFQVLARQSSVLGFYWQYCEHNSEAPKDRKALEEWALQQPKTTREQIAPELDAAEEIDATQVTDFNASFYQAWQEARVAHMKRITGMASLIATGESSKVLDKRYRELYGEDESKWDRVAMAERVLIEKLASNPFDDAEENAGGIYQEHTEQVRERLLESFQETEKSGALLTLFPSVDKNVIIGTGFQQLRFVGIAGQSGRGKTLLLLTLAYNFAKQGKHVLFNSLEHSFEDTWIFMSFLHASYFKEQGRFEIPPLDVWTQGNRSTRPPDKTDLANFDEIQKDARDPEGHLLGRIDACQYRTWNEISNRAITNYSTIPYDVIIVDYLEALKDAQSKYRADDEYIKLIQKVHHFTQDFQHGTRRGMVVITPLTITKEGAKEAEEITDDNPEIPFKDTAIRGSSQVLYELDLALGIHSTKEMREKYRMLLWGLKKRHGKQDPPLTLLDVDRCSKHVRDRRDSAVQQEEVAMQRTDTFEVIEQEF
jgi:hypothetical protein